MRVLLQPLLVGDERKGSAGTSTRRVAAPLAGATLFLPRGDCAYRAHVALPGYVLDPHTNRKCYRLIVARRAPEHVEVYEMVEHARCWYRSLCYTSDCSLSLGAPARPARHHHHQSVGAHSSSHAVLRRGEARFATEPQPSLEISRRARRGCAGDATRQTFVPRRLLRGALPDALLDEYVFWRNHDDAGLCGYEKRSSCEERVTCLRVALSDGGPDARPVAQVERYSLVKISCRRNDASRDTEEEKAKRYAAGLRIALPEVAFYEQYEVDSRCAPLVLLRLGGSASCAETQHLCRKLAALDALAHVLVWCADCDERRDGATAPRASLASRASVWLRRRVATEVVRREIRRVELPRLGLSFCRDDVCDDTGDDDEGPALAAARPRARFRSLEYLGMCLADASCLGREDDMDAPGDALSLLAPLPAALLLRDSRTRRFKVSF